MDMNDKYHLSNLRKRQITQQLCYFNLYFLEIMVQATNL